MIVPGIDCHNIFCNKVIGVCSRCNIITFSDIDTNDRDFEDMYKIFLYELCYIMELILKQVNIGEVSTDCSTAAGYFVLNFKSS